MRTTLLLLVAACGGSVAPVRGSAEPATEPAPPPAPPPPAQDPPIWTRLGTVSGPVPGLESYTVRLEESPYHCGGARLITTRDSTKPIPASEQSLADLFAVEFPSDLDLTEGEKFEQSVTRYTAWSGDFVVRGHKAYDPYERELAAAKDAASKVGPAARLVQIGHRMASVIAYAEIPVNARSGESAQERRDHFCSWNVELAETFLNQSVQNRAACIELAKSVAVETPAWWQQVCVTGAN